MALTLEAAPSTGAGVFVTLKFSDSESASIVRDASDDIVDSASTSYNFSKAGRAARASQSAIKHKGPVQKVAKYNASG